MKKIIALALFLVLTVGGCKSICGCYDPPPNPSYIGLFPTEPVNMGNINSEYDDYNSSYFPTGATFALAFSSNRNSAGKDFDFVFKYLWASYAATDSTRTVKLAEINTGSAFIADNNIIDAINVVNSSADELGPYAVKVGTSPIKNSAGYTEGYRNQFAFMYATSEPGNLDIRFVENQSTSLYGKPLDIGFLNSSKDDAYPCIMPDTSAIYFCSNREGSFDIFKATMPASSRLMNVLLEKGLQNNIVVTKDSVLSSPYEDKCPFIQDNLLIFTSNRPGGFGGFDLYYSKRENGKWSAPMNFGPKINTAADEYRPILPIPGPFFANNMMIFSSNRAGGKGGFDLYYVGIDKALK